ncbi:sugar (and other) transporter family protein, partial [Vibrio parahaemolyticus 10296]
SLRPLGSAGACPKPTHSTRTFGYAFCL